jgi:hypothetical protein
MARDHFEKQAYKPGQVNWNFNLIFDDQSMVAYMAKQYANIIQHPGLYSPIPALWLHSTILAVGPTDGYTEAEMLEVAVKLQQSLAVISLPEFSFDSWWLWGGNVVLHISPDDEFTKLYNHVVTALSSVVGPDRTTHTPHGNFIAHTAMAYSKTHHKEHEVHEQLAAHPIKPVKFKATHLPLTRQWPTEGHYEWEVVRDIKIGVKT